jgi:hypothetical protein
MIPYTQTDLDPRLSLIQTSLALSLSLSDTPATVTLLKSLSQLLTLKHPIPLTTRAKLIQLLYGLATSPRSDLRMVELACGIGGRLIKIKEVMDGELRLDWRVLYDALKRILYPKVRGKVLIFV